MLWDADYRQHFRMFLVRNVLHEIAPHGLCWFRVDCPYAWMTLSEQEERVVFLANLAEGGVAPYAHRMVVQQVRK